MKAYLLTLLVSGTLILSSCSKLDEGSNVSLSSIKKRLSREWVIDSVGAIVNGYSVSLSKIEMKSLKITFDKKGGLKYNEIDTSGIEVENLSTWTWELKNYLFNTNFNQSQNFAVKGERKYIVKRLTRTELILQDHIHGHRLYFHSN